MGVLMSVHPNDLVSVNVRAVRPSSVVPGEGRFQNKTMTTSEKKELMLARKSYQNVCAKARQEGIVPMVDGTGRVLQLPEYAVVMDCCNCRRAMSRDWCSLPAWAQSQLEQYGGSESDGLGHSRPLCTSCHG